MVDVKHLMNNIPSGWHGLFRALSVQGIKLEEAESWYNDQAFSRYGSQPDWTGLLCGLASDEPVSGEETIQFIPKFLHFPYHIQHHLLTFLLQHRHSIPVDQLNCFLTAVQPYLKEDESWLTVLVKMLSTYVLSLKSSDASNGLMTGYQYKFASFNRDEAMSLCQELKNREPVLPFHMPVMISKAEENFPEAIDAVDTSTSRTQAVVGPGKFDPVTDDLRQPENEVNTDRHDVIMIEDSEEIIDDVANFEPPQKIAKTESQFESSALGPGLVLDHTICTPQLEDAFVIFSQSHVEKVDKLKELWQSSSSTDVPAEIDIFLNSSPDEVRAICQRLGLSNMSESCLMNVCQNLITLSDVMSHGNCVEFLTAALVPKVTSMTQSACRTLAGIILLVAEKFSKPFIDSVVVNCVNTITSNHQTDLICKVTKEVFSNSDRVYLLKKILTNTETVDENIVGIFQTVVDTKVEIEENDLEEMLLFFSNKCQGMEKSTKFGKLILAIINRYGKQITKKQADIITQIIHSHGTFLKKSLETALKKLKPV